MSGLCEPAPASSRRRFIQGMLGVAASTAATRSPRAGQAQRPSPEHRSRVVVVRDPQAIDSSLRPNPERLRSMIERGLCLLTGRKDCATAWRALVSPEDMIGLKVNCLGGVRLCTHPAFADAVAESLVAAGFPADRIVIWDRNDIELKRCGFRLNKDGAGRRCFGTKTYEKESIQVGGVTTSLSTLATRETTATINLPVLKSHTLAGFSGALKNELGCVNNAPKFHPQNCRAAADLSAHGAIARKRRLIICDALRPLYDKGPTDMPRYRWVYGAMLFATDPVAVDLVGRNILEEKRRQVRGGQSWPLSPPPAHLERAIELGLGAASLDAVERIEA